MAESPYLRFQDKNKDGLIDICETNEIVPTNNCPPCQRKPNAIVPLWKNQETRNPWFNEKYCLFQCTVVTGTDSIIPPANSGLTADEYVVQLFESNQDTAINSLLEKFNKAKSTKNNETLLEALDYTKYDLDPRPGSVLKLLYSVDSDIFALLDEAETPSDEDDTEGEIVVKYRADDLFAKLMKFRKAMYLFSRYYRVYQATEGGLYYFEDGSAFTTSKFDRYGDAGFFVGKSIMADVLTDLDNWLNDRNYNIFGVGGLSLFNDRVTDLEFTFDAEYNLTKLRVWSISCGTKPITYKDGGLSSLTTYNSFSDKTAMAYFTKLNEMESHLSARVERPWTEFIEKYTYPKISNAVNNFGNNGGPTALSCVGDALLEEGKQLGQDIVDDIFSIGDAIAYAFHKSVCKKSLGELQLEQEQYGQVYKKDPKTGKDKVDFGKLKDPKTGEPTKINEMAIAQAFEKLEDSDQPFVQMCAALLQGSLPLGTSNKNLINSLFRDGFARVKLCGLVDLMVDAIQCLFKGLTLEQALRSAVKAALDNMAISDFGQLFIGLPPDKQAEMDALVRKKLAEKSKLNLPDKNLSAASAAIETEEGPQDDSPFFGRIQFTKPWQNEKVLEQERESTRVGNFNEDRRQQQLNDPDRQRNERTLAQRLDAAREDLDDDSNNLGLSTNVIMEAYILALIDTYKNDLLSLVDLLNQYPGAQIIAKTIAIFDCPRPPMFDPNFLDFIKSVDLPFCRDIQEIKLPHLDNPLKYISDIRDIAKAIYQAFLFAVQRVILMVIMRILVKICEIIGSAICKALETVGDLAASLPDIMSGRDTVLNVIRASICGDDASDEQFDATIADMFAKFGVGGAAFSEVEAIKDFLSDLSSATTTGEVLEAFNDEPSQAFLDAAQTIIVNQYPQFSDALRSKQDIADLFSNIGKLCPIEVRDAINNYLEEFPDLHGLPANPSLCATPEDLEDFKERRCILLEGRATPEQCEAMFDGLQNDLLEDLEELTQLAQGGIGNAIEDALGPLVSSPGCDDGIIPFETEATQKVAGTALSNTLEQLKVDYSRDMLGNGGIFADDADWGMMNMVLADTFGRALSTHRRKSYNDRDYVDFFNDINGRNTDISDLFKFLQSPKPTDAQKGAFPAYVAEQLFYEIRSIDATFNSDNSQTNVKEAVEFRRTFEQLGFNDLFGTNIELIEMPDFGYNNTFGVDMSNEEVVISKAARKSQPDLLLEYRDNDDGRERSSYSYGFDIKMFLADIEQGEDENGVTTTYNRPDDNIRISIVNVLLEPGSSGSPTRERKYEFLSVDNTLDDVDFTKFPSFSLIGQSLPKFIPQVMMLSDMTGLNPSFVKPFHDSIMSNVFNTMLQSVAGAPDSAGNPTKTAWLYGAEYDDLTEEDLEYVVTADSTESPAGTPYGDAKVLDYDSDGNPTGDRDLENDDMVLGISRMQHEENQGSDRKNRVFYLNPQVYGGSYKNPSIYIKPVENKGWLGMTNVIFPEIGPCKPQQTDLVDFAEIADEISSAYTTITEDMRLKQSKQCAVEKPYNRILERASKAGIQGIIKAAARIYSSTHFIKSMATFTTFDASIKNNYSSVYASYVVEVMEKDFKDATYGFFANLSPFTDQEFWYSFLEQAVQTYGRLVDGGEITDPPEPVLQALFRLNDAQESYDFPFRNDLKRAKDVGRARTLQTLKSYRNERNLEAIRATEDDAKLVLKEFIRLELNAMATKFNTNLKDVGLEPEFKDLSLYFLNKFAQGTENLDADKELVEEVIGLPDSGDGHYTSGGELALPDGTPYIGYYHVHENDDGITIYMAGERHSSAAHDELTVFANKISLPIGDIDNFGTFITNDAQKPFVLQKYIKVAGVKYDPTEAMEIIKSNRADLNISDVYPGTLKHVYANQVEGNIYGEPVEDKTINESAGYTTKKENVLVEGTSPRGGSSTKIVGLEGELGVRYGLEFSVIINGDKQVLTSVEVDALDLKIDEMAPLEPNSKLLYCLVNNLIDDETFKIITNYIVPLNKITAVIAIYNDKAFIPSIGQITVEKGKTEGNEDLSSKPGMSVFIDDETGQIESYSPNAGWSHYRDRNGFLSGYTPFFTTWDEWDKQLLRHSRARIKKIFRTYYNSRDFDPSNNEGFDAGKIIINNFKANLNLPPGMGLLPWWKRNKLQRNSPFNAKGELCKKKD